MNLSCKWLKFKFPQSRLAHKYLDGLRGIEIGGSAHNPFGLDTQNVDYTDNTETIFKSYEKDICGEAMAVDIVAPGDVLPIPDESQEFVLSSHVLEHFPDSIRALKEWTRVIKKGGYIFMIVPHKDRIFDKSLPRTTLLELIERHEQNFTSSENHHFSVWVTEDVVELCEYLGLAVVEAWDIDDKAGNGFIVIVRKIDGYGNLNPIKIRKFSRYERIINHLRIIILKLLSVQLKKPDKSPK